MGRKVNMDEEQACEAYWEARDILQEIIDSGERGSKEEILRELGEEDLK